MIKSFHHKGLQLFFETGNKAGIQSMHAPRLSRQLARLNEASSWEDMNLPGWRLHVLKGKLVGHFSIVVSGNWRLTFKFEGEDAVLVNYQDYH
ncbi:MULTISPECIES: type II toxin-antitoxin system RelE/ParE family toxin [unclassified Polynucleobacter]|jgi:proteic killer suppression protein|uniref:type II toxin-antitoxin system RelE/ParE family toxin n=1 Tax=unclassified Polynucleobacter TaxID=2640945 RepID=UPI001BFD944E|nr:MULTISPECIES: type II toxin-antitoxin system RelE/ParE family toxin [unclassified Polynucleobacter]MBU3605179.1 type II toxin-antitoxin system RelE/ParE family toxin [Polynucleobacter sp. MWH-Creno-3A4]QWD77361.1 type II toxin-antitoxin system RelE/ParE family toxin [Polynucleobacter sp. MWH-Svant-W18]